MCVDGAPWSTCVSNTDGGIKGTRQPCTAGATMFWMLRWVYCWSPRAEQRYTLHTSHKAEQRYTLHTLHKAEQRHSYAAAMTGGSQASGYRTYLPHLLVVLCSANMGKALKRMVHCVSVVHHALSICMTLRGAGPSCPSLLPYHAIRHTIPSCLFYP